MFYTTIEHNDRARFIILGLDAVAEPVEEAKAHDDYAPDIEAFIERLKPPEYSFPIDAALARQRIFEAAAASATARMAISLPTRSCRSFPLNMIGPTQTMRAATDGSLDRFYDSVTRSFYGEYDGHVAHEGLHRPPTRRNWATAPFLRQGSVPETYVRFWPAAPSGVLAAPPRPADLRPYCPRWEYDRLPHGSSAVAD